MADNSDLMERTMKRIDPPRKEGSTVSSRNRGETFSLARDFFPRFIRADQSRFTEEGGSDQSIQPSADHHHVIPCFGVL